jgi:ubiquinone/menaquinone biosynthesis C-methylase UbiE
LKSLPKLHNKHLHEFIITKLNLMAPGKILDIPSGPGYLIKKLQKCGFTGCAAEIDSNLYFFDDVEYKPVDMSKKFPFTDKSFEYVISIEGIEHIENHFSFLSEVERVLKKEGVLILTTPNVHSLESKVKFLFSGFHSLVGKPIPVKTKNIYFEHINPISFEMLYFICERLNLHIDKLETSKFRRGSLALYYILYPFIYISTYIACFKNEKNHEYKKNNKRLFNFLMSKANLAGGHTIITARK